MFEDRQRIFILEQDYNTNQNKLKHLESIIQDLQKEINSQKDKISEMDLIIQKQNQIIQENEIATKSINNNYEESLSKIKNNQFDLAQNNKELENIIELQSKAIQTSQILLQKCMNCACYINIINEKQKQDLKYLDEYQEHNKQLMKQIENKRKNFDLDKILASNKDELQIYKAQFDEQLIQIQQKKEKYMQAKEKETQEKIAFNSKNFKQ